MNKGSEGFHRYYGELYGERWDDLQKALLKGAPKAKLNNPFKSDLPLLETHQDRWDPPKNHEYYLLDEASFLCARELDVQEGDRVLDLCAAPGGKSLGLLFLSLGKIELTCNELSNTRRGRLKKNLQDYLPSEIFESIRVSGHDGSRWGQYEPEAYDKIILDAPCSSEGHLLQSPNELDKWSLKRTKGLAIRQGALILSAFDALRPGGTLAYSTCALSPLENDDVVAKLLKKKGNAVKVEKNRHVVGEELEYGVHVLPDRNGAGPLYVARIKKEIK